MKEIKNNDIQKIEVGKMCFTIEDEQPDKITDDIRGRIETELFNIFKKYENTD